MSEDDFLRMMEEMMDEPNTFDGDFRRTPFVGISNLGDWISQGATEPLVGPNEQKVTPAMRRQMKMRRVGNLCFCARENGWKAQLARSLTQDLIKVVFVNAAGQKFEGDWSDTPEKAVTTAANRIAHLL
jgi:hypothetical protein